MLALRRLSDVELVRRGVFFFLLSFSLGNLVDINPFVLSGEKKGNMRVKMIVIALTLISPFSFLLF